MNLIIQPGFFLKSKKNLVAASHEVEIKTILHKRENDSICISRWFSYDQLVLSAFLRSLI